MTAVEKLVKENLDTEKSIRTYSGIYFNVFNPDTSLINIEDIAHSLSMQCRFNGHVKRFYSVAQHSVWVAERVPLVQQKAALLHDASEAYLSDMPSPIKKHFLQYQLIEDLVMKAIASKFEFQYPFDQSIKQYDREALEYEWNYKVLTDTEPENNWSPERAKQEFLYFFNHIENS